MLGRSRERARPCAEASISQGLLLSEFRIKGLRQRKCRGNGMLDTLLNGCQGSQSVVLTLFPASLRAGQALT